MTILSPGTPLPDPFPKGALLLVDKPVGWTSFDVVNKLRYRLTRLLQKKRSKIGHAGTLDPLATGLLIICTGEYTKKLEGFQNMPKTYEGVITFGATTASYDREKPVDAEYPLDHVTDEKLQALIPQFTGEIQQLPPIFSAVKVDGVRLYKMGRSGEEVEIKPRTVHIESLEIGPLTQVATADQSEPDVLNSKGAPIYLYPDYPNGLQATFKVRCSKGTYIRSLAHDIGKALNSGAYLSSLRRTETGGFHLENAWNIEELVTWMTTED